MAYKFPNTLSAVGIPGGELYKIDDDGTCAIYATKPPLGKHPIAGDMHSLLTTTEQTDFNKLLTTDFGL